MLSRRSRNTPLWATLFLVSTTGCKLFAVDCPACPPQLPEPPAPPPQIVEVSRPCLPPDPELPEVDPKRLAALPDPKLIPTTTTEVPVKRADLQVIRDELARIYVFVGRLDTYFHLVKERCR